MAAKKFAFILMGEHYDPQSHQACFDTGDQETWIFTVKNREEAKSLVQKLEQQGFGALEVCGAFGEAFTRELIELTGQRIPIGYITSFPFQAPQVEAFFGKK